MKTKIHPEYYEDAVAVCACGNKITVGSTRKELRVEVCSRCHPFYTGQLKSAYADTGGRVDRFKKKYGWKES